MSQVPPLRTGATVAEIQTYVEAVINERGFGDQPLEKSMLLLTEEIGELAKALRGWVGMDFSSSTKRTELEEEIADVLIVLISIANSAKIDLTQAIIDKETKNRQREWTQKKR